ncbi:MAG: PHP domain-containing protein [Treponema sp.]|nr:PHP domain-containing protein [Treponema sp.]
MIDLHTHSTASDGQYTPSELVSRAADASVSVLAITDHDTVAGLAEAKKAADARGILLVPGIEINIQWPTGEFHLLGHGLRSISQNLQSIIDNLQQERKKRNEQMVEKMRQNGFSVSLEEIEAMYPNQTLGRPHFAGFMVARGIVKTRQLAFDKYLAKGRPWYVERVGADLDGAITAIKDSGGVPVIAHPLSLYVSWGKIEPVLTSIKERGVEGLEAWHPGARVTDCYRLDEMARRLGFFITAGSDFHGEAIRADRKIGYTAGNKKIDDTFWFDELRPHLPQF